MSNSTGIAEINVRELEAKLQTGESVALIDVRTPAEFQTVHAANARNVPLESFDPSKVGSPDAMIYVICASGGRSRTACDRLRQAGFERAVNVRGGTIAWERAGLPVVRSGQKSVSLERQVRIAAGSITAIGTALGAFVHPGFLIVPGFIGSGLLFSGLTDTCGMGLILAKMPWNQKRS